MWGKLSMKKSLSCTFSLVFVGLGNAPVLPLRRRIHKFMSKNLESLAFAQTGKVLE